MLLQCNSTCVKGCNKCAKGILALEPDFRGQKCMVAEVIERHGHLAAFLPKDHPELNPIEYVWGRSKMYARAKCSYSLPALRTMIPECLGPDVITDEIVWKFFRRVDRIMDAYRSGDTYGTPEFKNKVYKSHRRVAEEVLDEDE
jgi:hypothetical protein